ncbi:hypothetical protein llap_8605 [Limosa lapponica baueri]|uniref:Rna-directed dna polymerase from mobile element jockey-like n=1 Tax=Limosa lapponica baueri TaxID=1758121 RepID=A0A2I0U4U2_LIMLA|nr:hypothetical protein llap_8605 [Limosa lapponica baueri]
MVKQAVPLQLMEVHSGADIHSAAHGEPHAGAGSWQDLQPHGEKPMLEQVFWRDCQKSASEGLHPVKGPTLKQFVKNCSPWDGLNLEKLMENCFPREGPCTGAGEKHEDSSPLRRKEQKRQRMVN